MRKNIVALILEQDGLFLVEKRHSSELLDPGCYAFPGGHVDGDESLEEAIKREAEEEIGVKIIEPKLVHTAEYEFPEEKQKLYWYYCDKYEGKIHNHTSDELIWIRPDEIDKLTYQVGKDALSAALRLKKR